MRYILSAFLPLVLSSVLFAEKPARPFDMGFSPFPYDWPDSALEETYRLVNAHSDLILHHFDDGVPWPEALSNRPYPPEVEKKIAYRLNKIASTPGGRPKVYLALTPISGMRDGLAGYWEKDSNRPRPGVWSNKSFSDPEVLAAYLNSCRRMIGLFKPDYFAYAIEANLLAINNPALFYEFVPFALQVYRTLKAEYPGLPVFLTIQIDQFNITGTNGIAAVNKLLPYTDYLAVSSYPYTVLTHATNLTPDWFGKIRKIAPNKPFAVAETGYPAEDLEIRSLKMRFRATPEDQAEYVRFLLRECSGLDARFVCVFLIRDYDALWKIFESLGMQELFKIWKDTGFTDESGRPRPALKVWDDWLKKKKAVR